MPDAYASHWKNSISEYGKIQFLNLEIQVNWNSVNISNSTTVERQEKCNYLKLQKHENKIINPSKLSPIMRKALYVHRPCPQHQPSTILPKYSQALKMQS